MRPAGTRERASDSSHDTSLKDVCTSCVIFSQQRDKSNRFPNEASETIKNNDREAPERRMRRTECFPRKGHMVPPSQGALSALIMGKADVAYLLR